MIPIVTGVMGLLAVFAWIIAVISAVQIVGLAPKGQRMRTYGRIGWWKFAEIRADLGEAAVPHITTYQRAFTAFILLIIAGIAVGTLVTMQRPPA